jgi:hypothetical protein
MDGTPFPFATRGSGQSSLFSVLFFLSSEHTRKRNPGIAMIIQNGTNQALGSRMPCMIYIVKIRIPLARSHFQARIYAAMVIIQLRGNISLVNSRPYDFDSPSSLKCIATKDIMMSIPRTRATQRMTFIILFNARNLD